ncbi:MAG: putative phage abortive infection protein [Pseudomonadota bacterium]
MADKNKLSETLTKYPFRFGIGAISALLLLFLLNFRKADISPTIAEWGQFGDYFGGVLNPFFGLISLVIVAATLRSQTQAAARQAFENQFFALLELHASVLNSIDRNMKDKTKIQGRDCFRFFYRRIVAVSQNDGVPISTAYQRFLEKDGWEIEHYFRTVYHMFKHVKDGCRSINATEIEQKRYYDLIKSQLSQYELVLLWLNVEGINRGNWDTVLNESQAKPFEHLNKANLIENPARVNPSDVAE